MDRRRFYRISSLVLFIVGMFFLLNSQANITGAVIGLAVVFPQIEFFVGLCLVLFAGIVFVVGGEVSDLEVLISKRALERARKDSRIQNDIRRYVDEIKMIMHDPRHRPQERLGEFQVSPRGKSKGSIRVAWHLKGNILYIDDLLYHTRGNHYVGKWARKADSGKITKKDYEKLGYESYTGQI